MKDLAIALYFAGGLLLADTLGQLISLGEFYGLEFMAGSMALFFGVTSHLISNTKGN